MSYASREASAQDGSPYFLAEFRQEDAVWRYTTSGVDILSAGHAWEAVPMLLGAVNQSGEMSKDVLSFGFPLDNLFARGFLTYSPDSRTSVTLFRGHVGDPEVVVYWKGRVATVKASGSEVSLECEPIFTSLRRPGLRARYQKSCRHALYHTGCTLDKEDFAVEALCTAASGSSLTVPSAALLPTGYLIGGMVRGPDGSFRYVVDHQGPLLTLMRPLEVMPKALASGGYGDGYGEYYGGPWVRLYPGCDHSRSMCQTRFLNSLNYGGFDWIPSKNPFGGSSIV